LYNDQEQHGPPPSSRQAITVYQIKITRAMGSINQCVAAYVLLQDAVTLERWALVCITLGDGVAVAGIAVRLGLVPWQLVQVILEELVASRPVLIALLPSDGAK
jgi:hypothetical protein